MLAAVAAAVDAGDVLALVGLICLAWGLALWDVPLALVVVGSLLIAAAVLPAVAAWLRPPGEDEQ